MRYYESTMAVNNSDYMVVFADAGVEYNRIKLIGTKLILGRREAVSIDRETEIEVERQRERLFKWASTTGANAVEGVITTLLRSHYFLVPGITALRGG